MILRLLRCVVLILYVARLHVIGALHRVPSTSPWLQSFFQNFLSTAIALNALSYLVLCHPVLFHDRGAFWPFYLRHLAQYRFGELLYNYAKEIQLRNSAEFRIPARSYDPVIVAAASQQNLHFMLPQPPCQRSTNAYIRKRSSLVEALSNSLFADSELDDGDDENAPATSNPTSIATKPTNNNNNYREKLNGTHRSSLQMEQVYSIQRVMRKVSSGYEHLHNGFRKESTSQLELPARLVQKSGGSATKRSRSHPVHSPIHIDSDEEDGGSGTVPHVSRLSAYAFFNGLRTAETSSSSNDHSVRSSVHSTSSSMTASSTVSSGDEQCLLSAEAVWEHVAILPDDLPFATGDIISVLDYSSHAELWYGSCRERTGWFPSSYVRVLSGNSSSPEAVTTNYFPQSMRFLRAKIVQELLQTERDYVNLLQNIVVGFVEQCRRRSDLFPAARVQRLFGNIESIYALHCKFLRELELAYDQNIPENSAIGAIFLRNRSKFSIYSEYCNNRPVSSAELSSLHDQPHYYQFFEACRLLKGMPKLPLEGFLLTPVQRICRYPLQLAELVKATPQSHIDREHVQAAATTMKSVAALINEKKRRLEGLQQIALWQMNVEGWRGPDLLETNSRMVHSGEVYCRCVIDGNIIWHKDVLLFLFDQSLVLCKKDLIKRNFYLFRDRVSLASATFLDCDDGKDTSTGLNLKNSWKIIMIGKEMVFTCKDRNSKQAWVEHLRRPLTYSPATSEERRLVRETICRTSHGKLLWNHMDAKTNGRFTWRKSKN